MDLRWIWDGYGMDKVMWIEKEIWHGVGMGYGYGMRYGMGYGYGMRYGMGYGDTDMG